MSAEDASHFSIETVKDGVYYLVSPSCPACAINIPFLDSLSRRGTLQVVVVSRDATVSELRQYARSLGSALTFVANPQGYVERVIPRWLTPVSLIILGGKLRSIIPGRLEPAEKSELLAFDPHMPPSGQKDPP